MLVGNLKLLLRKHEHLMIESLGQGWEARPQRQHLAEATRTVFVCAPMRDLFDPTKQS